MKKIVSILTFLILLTSCISKTSFEKLTIMESNLKSQADFRSYLGLEYLDFARNLRSVGDEKVAEYFATKGINIINDGDIIPESPMSWDADQAQIKLMVMMQKRLEDVMASSFLKKNIPIQMAHLTFLYDCWISRESKSIYVADELARCRVRFTKLLNEIEYYLLDSKRDRTEKVKIIDPEFDMFRINFDFNSFKLNQKASKDLYDVLKFIADIEGNYRILLLGNADRSGKKLYNKSLSLKRINTVKNYLIKNGVSKDFIESKALGEEYPDIITFDGAKKKANRTVEIFILKGEGHNSLKQFPIPLMKNYIYRQGVKNARLERGLKN